MPSRSDASTDLLRAARQAASTAYSPYSRFRVGAAVRADNNMVVGCNSENASYGLTVCAERVAILKAVSAGAQSITSLAISCPDATSSQPSFRMPCGACRQVMAEFAAPNFIVIVDGVGEFTMEQLLPNPFKLPKNSSVGSGS